MSGGEEQERSTKHVDVWTHATADELQSLEETSEPISAATFDFQASDRPWRSVREGSCVILCSLRLPVRDLRALIAWLDGSLARNAVLWGQPGRHAARREFIFTHRRTRVVLANEFPAAKIHWALRSLVDEAVERAVRFPSEIPGLVRTEDGSTHKVSLENFSRTGLFIRSDRSLNLGMPVEVEFERNSRLFRESVIPMRFEDGRGVGAQFEDPSEDWLRAFDHLSKGSVPPPAIDNRLSRLIDVPTKLRFRVRLQLDSSRIYLRVRSMTKQGFRASHRGALPDMVPGDMDTLMYWVNGSVRGRVKRVGDVDRDGTVEFVWTELPEHLERLLSRISIS